MYNPLPARLLLAACLLLLLSTCSHRDDPPRILIFSKTTAYRHESIPAGVQAMYELCRENGMLADTTEDAAAFTEKNLRRYAAVVFMNTNGELLNAQQECDFERFIQAGGGYVGVHSAAACEYTWRWYGGLVGGYFKDHPPIQETPLHVADCQHPATEHLCGQAWPWKDEWYNFRHYEPDIHTLITINETQYQGGAMPVDTHKNTRHPLAWYHTYDGGRAFYTALGHRPESYADPAFRQHLLGGLKYAVGRHQYLRYDRCRTPRAPDPTRFVKTVVADDLAEPMEIALLPNQNLLLIERHGYLKQLDRSTGRLFTVAKLPVYSEMGDGLLGIAVDPHYAENHWIYLYYSSLRDSMNQLSRFVFTADTLDRASEKVLLTIPVGHYNCFHAAGSLAFDEKGLLYLSTGDNTSPFASDGFAPIDGRPGRQAFDARRSAANTMDLRGKILRIQPLPDGTYQCPPDNLFPHGGGRPEIYVMGCRNPFRISLDTIRHWLFWGDIGPDAGKDDARRGPMGHDEINLARQAGNFGWPLLVGNNQPYRTFDFDTRESGAPFSAQAPLNQSPHNTGADTLPPAQPALIWYPYGKNRDFPMLGAGGRNAMAGPVFYAGEYPEKTRFPEYYNGKVLIYDWMRHWIMAVTLDSSGQLYRVERLGDSLQLSRPMDMLFDQNGTLWVLEYGTRWYSSNPDARLSRIDFQRGNRPPKAALRASITAGAAPLELTLYTAGTRDNDGDRLEKTLYLPGEKPVSLRGDSVRWQFTQPGAYEVRLDVRDPAGATATARCTVQVGNAPPRLRWHFGRHNRSFYTPGETLSYQVQVQDAEDGVIASDQVGIRMRFEEKWPDQTTLSNAAAAPAKFARGKLLTEGSDCYSCHAIDREVNGPSFQAVAARYRKGDFGVPGIYRKIIYGGSGNWGKGIMIPHPNIREEDAIQMALWILSLADPPKPEQQLPPQGQLWLEKSGIYVLEAEYTDRGALGRPPLRTRETLLLRPATQEAEACNGRSEGVGNYSAGPGAPTVLVELKHKAWFMYKKVELAGLHGLELRLGSSNQQQRCAGGQVEIRAGSRNGPLLAQASIPADAPREERVFSTLQLPFQGSLPEYARDVYVIFSNPADQFNTVTVVDWVRFY
jgi:cytochrome c